MIRYEGLHERLSAVYETDHTEYVTLAAKKSPPKFEIAKFKKAVKHVHGTGRFAPEMLRDEPVRELAEETVRCLKAGLDFELASGEIPQEMRRALQEDIFVFSGCKTYHELREASQLLRDETGRIKPFEKFYEDIKQIHPTYNERYLQAEQEFAVHSAQAAAQWAAFEADGDRYDLTYCTAQDGAVRPSHAALEGITLPPEHPFWLDYMTPNGWRCRCRVKQTLRGKYKYTDGAKALELGRLATTDMDKHGRNRAEMFRFNPGKQKVIFPPNHPYYKMPAEAKKIIKGMAAEKGKTVELAELIKGNAVSDNKLSDIMMRYAALFPEDYNGGLKSVVVKRTREAFMSNGKYALGGNQLTIHNANFMLKGPDGKRDVFNPAKEVKGALLAIRDGKKLSFNQEYALEALWHETLHAKAVGWKDRSLRSDKTIIPMEAVNQFCARHTYPQFVERLGGKAENQPDVIEHGYGYAMRVTNFRSMLKHYGLDEKQTQKDLMPVLLSEPYEKVGIKTIEYLKEKGIQKAEILMESVKYSPDKYKELFD